MDIPSKQGLIACLAISTSLIITACTADRPPKAQSAASSGRQCFLASQVNSFQPVDRDTVIVTVGAKEYYQLEILGTCRQIDWSTRIALRTRGGGSWICDGHDAELIVPSLGSGLDRCPVLDVQAISPEAARATLQKR